MNLKAAAMNSILKDSAKRYQAIFLLLALIVLIALPILSLDFGITWDEWMQSHYGKLIMRFLISGGQNHDFMQFAETTYLYGGLFDTLAGFLYGITSGALEGFLKSDVKDSFRGVSNYDLFGSGLYETRHILNSLFGFLAILSAGLIAKQIASWRAACLALLFLTFSPHFFGHSMNNPKDLPFATAYIFSIFFLIRFAEELPKPKLGTLAGVAIGIALAIGTRVGGILLIFYLGLFSFAAWFLKKKHGNSIDLLPAAGIALAVAIAGFLLGLIFWPYGLMNPIAHPLLALKTFSNFTGGTAAILFEGKRILNTELPWYYVPKWIGITSPLFIVIGLFLFVSCLLPLLRIYRIFPLLCLLFSALFPLATAIISRPILYDGWRHFLFVYPPIVVLAAVGWDFIFEWVKNRKVLILSAGVLTVLWLQVAGWMIKNHPHEYVYFNPIVGGIDKVGNDYQTDYWGNCIRDASQWLGNHIKANRPGATVLIHADGNVMSSFSYLKQILGDNYVPYQQVPREIREKRYPDYGIFIAKSLSQNNMLNMRWPPAGALYTVKADNTVLCAVIENRNPAAQTIQQAAQTA